MELLETPPDLMLGVDPAAPRCGYVVTLGPGDLVLLFTDGLVEHRRAPLDERLAVLLALVSAHVGAGPERIVDTLLAALAGGAEDDVALLAVAVVDPGAPTSAPVTAQLATA